MIRFDAATEQPTPTGTGIDVIDVVKADIRKIGETESRQAIFPMVDSYLYLIWMATQLRLKLDPKESFVYEAVALDIERRAEVGTKKYGTRLKTNNGRNAIHDLYQEVLDAIDYYGQARIEGKL